MEIQYIIDSYSFNKNENMITVTGWALIPGVHENVKVSVIERTDAQIHRIDRPDVAEHFNNEEKSGKGIGWIIKLRNCQKFTIAFSYKETRKKQKVDVSNVAKRTISSKVISGIRRLNKRGLSNVGDKSNNSRHADNKRKTYRKWLEKNDVTDKEAIKQRNTKFDDEPLISVIIPVYNSQVKYLRKAVESVIGQTYSNWELCMVDGASDNQETIQVLKEYETRDDRIKVIYLKENYLISGNSNEGVKHSSGEYVALLDHDDVITKNALFEVVKSINENCKPDIIYSDEDKIDGEDNRKLPIFKPDWSPDLLQSQMYICHFLCFKRALFDTVGGFRSEFDGAQDYDFMLRISRETDKILHIPKILYSWRLLNTSTSINSASKPHAQMAGLKALDEHLSIKYNGKAYAEETENLFVYRARFRMDEGIKVSIIIPMKDKVELTKNCVESILDKTSSIDYEIIIVNNDSEEQETYDWFKEISKSQNKIKIINAPYEFNWSKLNNHGIREATGDVFVFLNNDTVVITEDWLLSMAENALRPDIGTVGALLLYEDGTIQHAGVVIGLIEMAEHVFKGVKPVHKSEYFISPVINRNVSSSTGACLAISRDTIDKIGDFDEDFIICGSDIEISLRALKFGYFNMLDAHARLYHLESKSRSPQIPEVDFELSRSKYQSHLEHGDPYYNKNLSLSSTTPKLNFDELTSTVTEITEVRDIIGSTSDFSEKRINIFVPSLSQKDIFGGISTALKFYKSFADKHGCKRRIIITDAAEPSKSDMEYFKEHTLVSAEERSTLDCQVVAFSDREGRTLEVGKNDIFIATAWWTAHLAQKLVQWQAEVYDQESKELIYLIQDYEPGFYSWSSRYALSESTYRSNVPVVAVFNSKQLYDFFSHKGYEFSSKYYFEPKLNDNLKRLLVNEPAVPKEKQILIYGRPTVARNAFEMIVEALKVWVKSQRNVQDWKIISIGEKHGDIELGKGMTLTSKGKLTLEEYAAIMRESYAGISLMISPHPSYPPLEMSTFGMRVITNGYENKNLSTFNERIISVDVISPLEISKELQKLCDSFEPNSYFEYFENEYTSDSDVFSFINEMKI